MSTVDWKDYSLSRLEDWPVGDAKQWYSPNLDRKPLKKIMKRSNGPALWNYGLWLGLLLATGFLTVWYWPDGQGWFWLLIYSAIHQSATARQHELSHGTPFKTRWLNEVFFHLCSFITLSEGHYYRWRHARHHTHTIIVGRDPEIQSVRPPQLISLLINIFNIKTVFITAKDFVARGFGNLGPGAHFIPESEQGKVKNAARVYLVLVIFIGSSSIIFSSWLPILLTIGPRVLGAPLYAFLHFTQHAGLDEDVYDHRLNTRTVYMNPVLRFLYCNMNYHIEHHLYPMVPYYRLPELHELIKGQCPEAKRGLFDAYRDIVPTLIRQLKDPAYHIQPTLPELAAGSK